MKTKCTDLPSSDIRTCYVLPSYDPCDWRVVERVGRSRVDLLLPDSDVPKITNYTKVVYVCLVPWNQEGRSCTVRLVFEGQTFQTPNFLSHTPPRDIDEELKWILAAAVTLNSGERVLPVKTLLQYPDWWFEIEEILSTQVLHSTNNSRTRS